MPPEDDDDLDETDDENLDEAGDDEAEGDKPIASTDQRLVRLPPRRRPDPPTNRSGEPANRIDWRRSARGAQAFVREREWEAAQTLWLWFDRSATMNFRSNLTSH